MFCLKSISLVNFSYNFRGLFTTPVLSTSTDTDNGHENQDIDTNQKILSEKRY